MSSTVVIGTQWGDEGKGKIVDYLAEQADVVVRYSGGSNAGHTVVVGEKVYKLHLLPSGILYDEKTCIIGNGVVLDPEMILQELESMKCQGITTRRLFISDRAHVIFPYHKKIDELQEASLGADKIGTTKKGIGPCYMDKMARIGIRVCDLLEPRLFAQKLKRNVEDKNRLLQALYNVEPFDYNTMLEEYLNYATALAPYIADTANMLHELIADKKKILYEGAQATFLDLDHGTYPYVTSSNPIAGGLSTGAGVGPKNIDHVVGVVKAYTTRVGEGPFPTELRNEIGDRIREEGQEYGTTTGRPRRCGWLDACVVRYAARINSLDYLAITRLDILDKLPTLKICTAYKYKGEIIKYMPASLKVLSEVEPVYEEFEGWLEDITKIRSYNDLPEKAKKYLARLSELTETPLGIVSVGPSREQTMIMVNLF